MCAKERGKKVNNLIDISKKPKAEVLARLYKSAKVQGAGVLHQKFGVLTKADAEALLKKQTYFDYLNGRVMKVDLSSDVLDPTLYDRDNGEGAALAALTA